MVGHDFKSMFPPLTAVGYAGEEWQQSCDDGWAGWQQGSGYIGFLGEGEVERRQFHPGRDVEQEKV